MRKLTDFDPQCKSVRTFCLVTKQSAFGGSKYQAHESQLANLCGGVGLSSTHLIPGHYFFPLSNPQWAAACTLITLTLGEQTSSLFCFYHKCHSMNQPLGHAQVQWNLVFPSQTSSITSTVTSASVGPMKFHKYTYCGWYKENFYRCKYIKLINIYRSRI